MAEEEHQLRDGALCRAIESAGHTGLQELVPCLVTMHLYAACPALRDVDNDDASLYRLFQHVEEPVLARGITTAKGLHHGPFQPGNIQYALHHLRGDAREELEDGDVAIQQVVWFQRFTRDGVINLRLVVFDIDTRMSQGWIVIGAERIEIICVDLAGSVASQQVVLEEDADLRHNG